MSQFIEAFTEELEKKAYVDPLALYITVADRAHRKAVFTPPSRRSKAQKDLVNKLKSDDAYRTKYGLGGGYLGSLLGLGLGTFGGLVAQRKMPLDRAIAIMGGAGLLGGGIGGYYTGKKRLENLRKRI